MSTTQTFKITTEAMATACKQVARAGGNPDVVHTRAMEAAERHIEDTRKTYAEQVEWALGARCRDLVFEMAIEFHDVTAAFVGIFGIEGMHEFQREVGDRWGWGGLVEVDSTVDWVAGTITFGERHVDLEPRVVAFTKRGYDGDVVRERLMAALLAEPSFGRYHWNRLSFATKVEPESSDPVAA